MKGVKDTKRGKATNPYVYHPLVSATCDGKKKYSRKEMADWFIPKEYEDSMHSYHCSKCGNWHIGHDKL